MAKEKEEITTSEEESEPKKKTKKSKKDDDAVSDKKDGKKSKKDDNAVSDKKEGKKSKKDKGEKKEPGKVAKWFKDLKIEFKKVVWPSRKTVINNTSVVLGVVVASAVLVGVLDEGFLALMRLIYQ